MNDCIHYIHVYRVRVLFVRGYDSDGCILAIGVPVMLAYVYGVVPYSLCRGGTCGVKSDNGTFSFDFGPNASDNNSGN